MITPEQRDFLERVERGVRAARERGARFRLTSYIRTPRENAELPGAAARSQHLYGLAVDFAPPSAILAESLREVGLYVIDRVHGTGPHVHAQYFPPVRVGSGRTTGPAYPQGPPAARRGGGFRVRW